MHTSCSALVLIKAAIQLKIHRVQLKVWSNWFNQDTDGNPQAWILAGCRLHSLSGDLWYCNRACGSNETLLLNERHRFFHLFKLRGWHPFKVNAKAKILRAHWPARSLSEPEAAAARKLPAVRFSPNLQAADGQSASRCLSRYSLWCEFGTGVILHRKLLLFLHRNLSAWLHVETYRSRLSTAERVGRCAALCREEHRASAASSVWNESLLRKLPSPPRGSAQPILPTTQLSPFRR